MLSRTYLPFSRETQIFGQEQASLSFHLPELQVQVTTFNLLARWTDQQTLFRTVWAFPNLSPLETGLRFSFPVNILSSTPTLSFHNYRACHNEL
jgi:hypothetical protein